MNRASIIALVIGAMLFGCGAGMVAHEVLESEAVAQDAWEGQRWDHTCSEVTWEQMDEDFFMSDWGEDGWEMVSLEFGKDHFEIVRAFACFKRPLD